MKLRLWPIDANFSQMYNNIQNNNEQMEQTLETFV